MDDWQVVGGVSLQPGRQLGQIVFLLQMWGSHMRYWPPLYVASVTECFRPYLHLYLVLTICDLITKKCILMPRNKDAPQSALQQIWCRAGQNKQGEPQWGLNRDTFEIHANTRCKEPLCPHKPDPTEMKLCTLLSGKCVLSVSTVCYRTDKGFILKSQTPADCTRLFSDQPVYKTKWSFVLTLSQQV